MLDVNENILNRELENNKLSHAYLFETDYSDENIEYIMNFVKNILTKNKSLEEKEIIAKRIDNDNFPELKIIKRDGQFIKKEQIIELKEKFSTKSQESSNKVYIIYEADKMNDSSANTLLKFLEEPEKGILGILLTNNIHSVMKTLISRCQIISLSKNSYIKLSDNYDDVVEFLYALETRKINIYAYITQFDKLFSTKDNINETLKTIIIILSDIIYYKTEGKYKCIIPNAKINKIIEQNSINEIVKKINIVNDLIENNKYNLNSALLLDKLIISMCGGVNDDSTN